MNVRRMRDRFQSGASRFRETASGNVGSYDEAFRRAAVVGRRAVSETVTYTFRRRQRRTRWTKWKAGGGRSDNGDAGLGPFA